NHREAWQAVLLVLTEFKDTWAGEKGAAMVLPTLLKRLRKGAFLPTSGSSYPCLLPFLAALPVETLLAPSDGNKTNKGAPFCADLVETLWSTVATSTSLGGDTAGGVAPGSSVVAARVADVASAQVECATLLLLKLPPPPQQQQQEEQQQPLPSSERVSSGENEVKADSRLATSVSVAALNLARTVVSFVLDETAAGAAGRTRMDSETLGRALGQLQL
ncbi:unnamed protein product, partial [Laminaria digitata]